MPFLEAICLRLAIFADPDINGAQLQEYLAQRRENNKVISPDFQAQLAEDECGEDYFRMFQALDVEAWNPGHAVIAALAAAEIVRAVITTNFDRLIELAITAAGQPARVVKDIAGFEEVAAQLAGSGTREQGVSGNQGTRVRGGSVIDGRYLAATREGEAAKAGGSHRDVDRPAHDPVGRVFRSRSC